MPTPSFQLYKQELRFVYKYPDGCATREWSLCLHEHVQKTILRRVSPNMGNSSFFVGGRPHYLFDLVDDFKFIYSGGACRAPLPRFTSISKCRVPRVPCGMSGWSFDPQSTDLSLS